MKRTIVSIILICTLIFSASCAAPAVKTDSSPVPSDSADNASAPAGGTDTAPASTDGAPAPSDGTPAPSEETAAAEQTASAKPSATTGSLTLAGIKKAAEAAGYEVMADQDLQRLDEPKPVDGFQLVYADESSQAYIPVYEFKSSEDALTFAAEVNEEGYNLCIVNGKFLTLTGAEYGVTINDKQAGILEKLLQSKVMAYEEPPYVPLAPPKDYAGACLHIDAIYKALDKLVKKTVLMYDKTAPEDAGIGAAGHTFYLLSSGDRSFTAALREDQASLDTVVELWELFGCKNVKLAHDKAHDYVLTGQRAGVDTSFELHCSFNPSTGALRLIDTDGGEVIELYEYVPLGNNTYAFQTLYSRALVEYKDGIILSFVYSLNEQGETPAYSPEADGIFENSGNADESWVAAAGEDSYEQFISFDGKTLRIAADSFMGDRLNIEIKAQ
jgi:hypothetical protein